MDAMEAIISRRSIRRYTGQTIPDEMIEQLLQAAMSAPSAGNMQPWQFVIIDDREILDKIPTVHPYADMVREAPLAILVCGDLQRDGFGGYWVQDCSAATENLLIAAHARGLGAVWLGVYPRDERVKALRDLLSIPEDITPFAVIALGYAAEELSREDRFDPSKVHRNHW
jgi:nitroreductase